MAGEVLVYLRSRVRSIRKNQRVRLGVVVTPATDGVFNLTRASGEYARTCTSHGNICLAWSPYGTPPFTHEGQATGTGDCSEGRFCWDPRRLIHLTYTRSGSVYERRSDDDGLSWNEETLLFSGGTHGDISADDKGTILRAAYVGGKIQATRQADGESAPGSAFYLKDDGAADLLVEDSVFRIVADLRRMWWLHCRIAGEGATSLWYSEGDDGATWKRTGGAVGGITGGTHPGLAAGQDGRLYAWSRVAGNAKVTRRAAGDADWATPAVLKDAAAADFGVVDAPFSFALAYEGPERLILAVTKTGETQASDWHSADFAATVARF